MRFLSRQICAVTFSSDPNRPSTIGRAKNDVDFGLNGEEHSRKRECEVDLQTGGQFQHTGREHGQSDRAHCPLVAAGKFPIYLDACIPIQALP